MYNLKVFNCCFVCEIKNSLYCIKSYSLLTVPCFQEEYHGTCDNSKFINYYINEIKLVCR